MVRTFTAAVHQEDDWYVARCLELDVASQGETLDTALANLREAVEEALEEGEEAGQPDDETDCGELHEALEDGG